MDVFDDFLFACNIMVVLIEEIRERLVKMQTAQQRAVLSFAPSPTDVQGVVRGETSRANDSPS